MRRLPGKKLEIWQHPKYGVKVEIRLDSSDGEFVAFIGDNRYGSKVLEDLRKALKKAVEESVVIRWIPILSADVTGKVDQNVQKRSGYGGGYSIHKAEWADEADEGRNSLTINYKRFWVAFIGAKWMICEDWTAPEVLSEGMTGMVRSFQMREWHGMSDVGEVAFPYTVERTHYDPVVYLPYSQKLWDSLVVVGQKMADLSERLNELLSTDTGRAKLESAMTGMLLPASTETEDEE